MTMNTVITNGCFEILHAGHAAFLSTASQLAPELIVYLNSDETVEKLKGLGHPLQPWHMRAYTLCELYSVFSVRPLEELTMTNVLLSVKPTFWVKGGDYTLDTLNQDEVAAARQVGTQIVIVPVMFDIHTSDILRRL